MKETARKTFHIECVYLKNENVHVSCWIDALISLIQLSNVSQHSPYANTTWSDLVQSNFTSERSKFSSIKVISRNFVFRAASSVDARTVFGWKKVIHRISITNHSKYLENNVEHVPWIKTKILILFFLRETRN